MKKSKQTASFILKSICILTVIAIGLFSASSIILAEENPLDLLTSSEESNIIIEDEEEDEVELVNSTVNENSDIEEEVEEESTEISNSNTGANSENEADISVSEEVIVNNQNDAWIFNEALIRSQTGNNIASFNTGSGIITTQIAKGNGELVNLINKNILSTENQENSSSSVSNENTGYQSENNASENLNNKITLRNLNSANVTNKIKASAVSGKNKADSNTGHGIIVSGNAELGLNLLNIANTNIINSNSFYADWKNVHENLNASINIGEEVNSNPSLSSAIKTAINSNTGANSSNVSIIQSNNEINIVNNNNGNLNNDIEASSISGQNTSNSNTGSASIATGEAKSAVNIVNFLNSNINASNWWLKAINIFGDWNGDLILPPLPSANLTLATNINNTQSNTDSGANSTNTTAVSSTQETTVQNSNTSSILNNVNIKTNTGNNLSSYNGGSGSVRFGKADAETNEINVSNINITGDSWWTLAINRFGLWSGTSLGSPSELSVVSDGYSTIISPISSGVEAKNNSTGPSSNNINGYNVNNSTEIQNTNSGQILNNLEVSAISGENETQYNTGNGYIIAGDVKAVNNIVNFANANITAGNWLIGIINVFGKWTGNLIFSNSTSSSENTNSNNNNSDSSSTNGNTGYDSTNNSESNSNSTTTVNNNNETNLNNNTESNAETGSNSASYNTGTGIVSTGGSDAQTSINNDVNGNIISVGTGGGATSTCANNTTGANSTNTCSSNESNETNINTNNNSNVTNNGSANANTGGNNSNYNTGDGVVDTGWANTFVDLYNQNNSNQITVGQVLNDVSQNNSTTTNSDSNNNNSTSTNSENNSQNNNNGNSNGNGGGGSGGGGSATNNSTNAISGSGVGSSYFGGISSASTNDFFVISANSSSSIVKIFPDGIKIEISIPSGTFPFDVVLTLSQANLTQLSTPLKRHNAKLVGNKVVKMTFIEKGGREITKLTKDINVKITYPSTMPIDNNSSMYYFDSLGVKWLKVGNKNLNENYVNGIFNRVYVIGTFSVPTLPDILKIKENGLKCQVILDYGNGNLLRDNANHKIFILTQGNKKYVSTIEELKKYYGPVYNVSGSELECYPTVDLLTLPDKPYGNNVMLRNIDTNRIYLITKNMRKYISSISTVKDLSQKGIKTINVSSDIIYKYGLLK